MDGANFVVKTVTDSTVMPAGSPGGGRDMMRGMGVTQTMDPRGHILKTEVNPPPGLPPFMASMMNRGNPQGGNTRGQITWPEGAVSPGYTWTDTIVQSAGGGGRGARPTTVTFIATYKFERIERQAGARVAVISLNGKGQGDVNATISGEFDVDLDAGRATHMVMNTSMPMGNATGVVRMTMSMQP